MRHLANDNFCYTKVDCKCCDIVYCTALSYCLTKMVCFWAQAWVVCYTSKSSSFSLLSLLLLFEYSSCSCKQWHRQRSILTMVFMVTRINLRTIAVIWIYRSIFKVVPLNKIGNCCSITVNDSNIISAHNFGLKKPCMSKAKCSRCIYPIVHNAVSTKHLCTLVSCTVCSIGNTLLLGCAMLTCVA